VSEQKRARAIQRDRKRRQILEVRVGTQHSKCIWCMGMMWLPRRMSYKAAANLIYLETGKELSRQDLDRRKATIDHIIPLCHGGSEYKANFVAACAGCNNKRGAVLTDWHPAPELLRLLPIKVQETFFVLTQLGAAGGCQLLTTQEPTEVPT
jgi:5-methylcytosine-specific restriction endonuclease McrA